MAKLNMHTDGRTCHLKSIYLVEYKSLTRKPKKMHRTFVVNLFADVDADVVP
jgi:hypothetical protein